MTAWWATGPVETTVAAAPRQSMELGSEDVAGREQLAPSNISLDDSRGRLEAVFGNALDSILFMDDEARFVDANPAASGLLGYELEEFQRLTVWDITPPLQIEMGRQLWEQFISSGKLSGEYTLVCRDGSLRDVEYRAVARIRPGLHFAIFHDITHRKLAEEKLRRSETQLAEAQRLTHIGSWIWNTVTGAVEWSDEMYRIFGLEPQSVSMTYEKVIRLIHEDDRTIVETALERTKRDHRPYELALRVLRQDDTVRWVHARGQLALDNEGQAVRMFGTIQDITERKQTQDQLAAYSARLKVLSSQLLAAQEAERRRIARELHDEIGQLLTAVKIDLQRIEQTPSPDGRSRGLTEVIDMIGRTLEHVRNLSLDLRPPMLDELGLAASLRWALDRHAQRAGFTGQLVEDTRFASRCPEVEIACFRVAQEALTNIARHARARHVRAELRCYAGELQFMIRDDGVGFDVPAARVRALQGGSLGLLGMQERAALLGGELEIESARWHGTEIRLRLPLDTTDETRSKGASS